MAHTSHPNILLFITDDHGAWATGYDGLSEIHTPTLDHLASTGTWMQRAYTPCPVCSPARACIWTGKMPSQTGVHDWLRESEPEFDRGCWIDDQLSLPEIFQNAGYNTMHVGKWHLAGTETRRAGFDTWCPTVHP